MKRVELPGPLPPAERGLASALVLPFLAIMVAPVLLALGLAREEAILSSREVVAMRARLLAESAVREWLARASEAGSGPDEDLLPGTAPPPGETLSGALDGGSYRVDVAPLEEGGLPLGYDRVSGFPEAPFADGGHRVFRLSTVGEVGAQRSRLRALVTWTPYAPPAAAVLSSAGPVRLAGPCMVDGRAHDAAGELLTERPGVAPVSAGGPVETTGEVLLVDGLGGREAVTADRRLVSPESFLGLPPDGRYLERRGFAAPGPPPWEGTVVVPGDYRGPVGGRGTLVVHNPRFDPVRYRASWEHSLGLDPEGYDSSYSHLDPGNQPAVLEPQGDCDYQGIIVTDALRPGTGSLRLLGQIAVLDPAGAEVTMTGGVTLLFAPETVRRHGRGPCDLLLEWAPGMAP